MRAFPGSLMILALAACGAEPEAPTAAPPPIPYAGPGAVAPAETPAAGAAAFQKWGYVGGDGHVLAFGSPVTEELAVVFRCEAEAPGVKVAFFQKETPPITVTVGSGKASAVYPVRPTRDPEAGIWSLSGDVPAGDPVFKAFLASGRLAKMNRDGPVAWDAVTPAEREAIKAFADGCKDKL